MSLGQAQGLTYMTLFSNPIADTKMYRTIMVNCCESLRGIDGYAVSDEEIIEGICFPEKSRYRTCSSTLALPEVLTTGPWEVGTLMAEPGDHRRARHEPTEPHATEAQTRLPGKDAGVWGRVMLSLKLLKRFHESVSPVIICQRWARRFLRYQRQTAAAIKIQAFARMRAVSRRAHNQLQELLRRSGRLYLMEELGTPGHAPEPSSSPRSLADFVQTRRRETSALRLANFVSRMKKRFLNFTKCLRRARVGGVVVASRDVGELVSAVTRAIVSVTPELSNEEALRWTAEAVTVVSNCRVLRPFSYADVIDWPFLDGEVETDGVFITRSLGVCMRRRGMAEHLDPPSTTGKASAEAGPSLDSPEEGEEKRYARRTMGLFSGARIRTCVIRRRGVSVGRLPGREPCGVGETSSPGKSWDDDDGNQVWVFDPTDVGLVARVLCVLRRGTAARGPVPCVFRRQMLRCAAATRLQAAWRGHVTRWKVLLPLTTCLVVQRASVCLQRWWRQLTGLTARLRVCRRLWALGAAVDSSTMYMELDVYFTLTNGWRPPESKTPMAFAFQSDSNVVILGRNPAGRCPRRYHARYMAHTAEETHGPGSRVDGLRRSPALPLSMPGSVGAEAPSSDVSSTKVLHDVGALLTEGVQVRRVIWPLKPRSTGDTGHAVMPGSERREGGIHPKLPGTASTAAGELSKTPGVHQAAPRLGVSDGLDKDHPVDLNKSLAGGDLVELEFPCAREARTRALVLAIATAGSDTGRNRYYFAQLMTLGMLRRQAWGKHDVQISSSLVKPFAGEDQGGNDRVLAPRGFGEEAGGRRGGVPEGDSRDGDFRVSSDSVQPRRAESPRELRNLAAMEDALAEMSQLPSKWRVGMSPFDASQEGRLKALRSMLPTTSPEVAALERKGAPASVIVHDRSIRGCLHAAYFDGNDPTGGIHVDALGPDRRERGRENMPRVRPCTTGSPAQPLSPIGSAKTPAQCWVGSGKIWEPSVSRNFARTGRNGEPLRAAEADSDGVLEVAGWAPDDFRRRHLGEVFLSYGGNAREAEIMGRCDVGDPEAITAREGRLRRVATTDNKNQENVGHAANGVGRFDIAQGEGEVAPCSVGARWQTGGTSARSEAETSMQDASGRARPRETSCAPERRELRGEQSFVPAEALQSAAIASATAGSTSLIQGDNLESSRPRSDGTLGSRIRGQTVIMKHEMAWRALQRDRELKGQERAECLRRRQLRAASRRAKDGRGSSPLPACRLHGNKDGGGAGLRRGAVTPVSKAFKARHNQRRPSSTSCIRSWRTQEEPAAPARPRRYPDARGKDAVALDGRTRVESPENGEIGGSSSSNGTNNNDGRWSSAETGHTFHRPVARSQVPATKGSYSRKEEKGSGFVKKKAVVLLTAVPSTVAELRAKKSGCGPSSPFLESTSSHPSTGIKEAFGAVAGNRGNTPWPLGRSYW